MIGSFARLISTWDLGIVLKQVLSFGIGVCGVIVLVMFLEQDLRNPRKAFTKGIGTARLSCSVACFALSEGLWSTARVEPTPRTIFITLSVVGVVVGLLQMTFHAVAERRKDGRPEA